MDFSDARLRELGLLCSQLNVSERKALITLARSQSIPSNKDSPILFDKVSPILNRICLEPPFIDLYTNRLTATGDVIVHMVQSPILTGLLIVFALGMPYTDDEIKLGWQSSFNKELSATQTRRLPTEWNWDVIIGNVEAKFQLIHPLFPTLSPLQYRFHGPLRSFRSRLQNRIILPHYSRKGVSGESAEYLNHRVNKQGRYTANGPRSTFHQFLDRKNVTSLDIIHHYIRTGDWIRGRTQMRQAWTPNILQPRTYFAWGGDAISSATYLRNLFNDIGDCFPPTHRKNRVRPDWLYDPNVPPGGFFFYDLTSFTSWFHEQVPFLQSLSRFFDNTHVYLVGENLSLSYHSVGSLIDGYIRHCNDFPPFILSKKLGTYGPDSEFLSLYHLCAGFLGIPGNLIMCTLPHGLAMASRFDKPEQLQVPGDDVGASFCDEFDRYDKTRCATTLGVLQMDKVYRLPEVAIYLKRMVVDHGSSISLADMLIYPLLPYLLPETSDRKSSSPYRLPPSDRIIRRACSVMVSFMRELWKLSKGDLNTSEVELILSFLQGVHDRLQIPYGAVWQSRFYCDEGTKRHDHLKGVVIKFPVVEEGDIRHNPDLRFADRYVEIMHIRSTEGVVVTEELDGLTEGQSIVVPKRRGWTFLEDMGYVRLKGIPGEVITLVGPDAKTAFLHAHEPNLREVEALCDLSLAQLMSVGVVDDLSDQSLPGKAKVVGSVDRDFRAEQSWRYNRYVDLDNPLPMRSKGPVSVRSAEFGDLESEDESVDGRMGAIELDY